MIILTLLNNYLYIYYKPILQNYIIYIIIILFYYLIILNNLWYKHIILIIIYNKINTKFIVLNLYYLSVLTINLNTYITIKI